jgi:zinc protease
MKNKIIPFILAGSILLLAFFFFAWQIFKPDQVLTPDPKILIGTLNNGLKYYIRENKQPEKRAELRLVVKAGSVLEDDDQQGLAHFDEHMAFRGTKSFPQQEIINFLEKSGMRFGADFNAYTSFDETVYKLQVPTDSQEVMKKGFQILEEWSHDVSYDDAEIDKERGVVIEEWRLRLGANNRVWMKHIPFEYYKSRYADRMPIGKKEILELCPHDALRRFYHDWYRPDLMAVLAVGDFDKQAIEKLIKEHFSGLTNSEQERTREQYTIPNHQGTLVSIVTDSELTRTSVEVMFKHETRDTRTVNEYRQGIINNLYDAMLAGRLRGYLQMSNPPFFEVSVYDGRFISDKQVFSLRANVKEQKIMEGIEALLTEPFRAKQYGFTSTDLELQKEQFLRKMEQRYNERDKTESNDLINEYIKNFLEGKPIPGIGVELALYKKFLPGITLEEVNKLSAERITSDNRIITISVPEKVDIKVPTEKEVLALVSKVSNMKLSPYSDVASTLPLISMFPSRGKIVSEKQLSSIDVTEWRLSNGARVILKSTGFKNDELLFRAISNGGTSLVADKDFLSAQYAPEIVSASGVGQFSISDLNAKLSDKIAHVQPMFSPIVEGLSGSASSKDIETLFQLIYLYGTSPRKDTAAFSSFIARHKASLQNRSVSPEAALSDTLQVTLAQYHYRSRPMTVDMLNEIQLDRALSIYKDRFSDFSNFMFFFVGNFKLEELKPLVEQYVASLPSTGRKETWKDIGMEPPKGVISKAIYKGIEQKSSISITFTGPFKWSQQNWYNFYALLEALKIKLREVLREDKGGTYHVSVSGLPSLYPRQEYSITLQWGCNPDRVKELVNTALLQIDSLKMKPLDPFYIEKVSETQHRAHEVSLKNNGFWLNNLSSCYFYNEDPQMILNYPKFDDGLTAKDIQRAAKKYFDMKNYIKVVLYPEKK